VDDVRLPRDEECAFATGQSRASAVIDDRYVLIGRGWVDAPASQPAERPAGV
jgi:hypothetical protein